MISFSSNNIIFRIAFPDYPVNLFVDHFVLMDGTPAGSQEERIFPNNKAEVFFNLGDHLHGYTNDSGHEFRLKGSVVSGLRQTYFTFHPGHYFSMAGLRFTLFGFHHLFAIPAQHFTNQNFDAMDVWGGEMELIRERLLETKSTGGRISVLHEWIVSKIFGTSLPDMLQWKRVEEKLSTLREPVASFLEKNIGYSHKHALRLIKEKAGLTPKMIEKVNRFNRSLRMLNHRTFVSWANLALDAGYADQSHFIREFRHFTGFTPAVYLKDKPRIYKLYQQLELPSEDQG